MAAHAATCGPFQNSREIRIRVEGAHRVFYVATLAEASYVFHAFEKKSQKTTQHDLEIGRERFRAIGKLRQEHGQAKRR